MRRPSSSSASSDEDETLAPQPLLTWADAVRAQDAACGAAPIAWSSFSNALTRVTAYGVEIRVLSARVVAGGQLYVWLEVIVGPPLAAAVAASGDIRPHYNLQVHASSRVIAELGVPDPWAAARSCAQSPSMARSTAAMSSGSDEAADTAESARQRSWSRARGGTPAAAWMGGRHAGLGSLCQRRPNPFETGDPRPSAPRPQASSVHRTSNQMDSHGPRRRMRSQLGGVCTTHPGRHGRPPWRGRDCAI